MRLQGALYQRFEAAWRGYAPPREVGRHQLLGRPRGHGPAAVEEIPPLGAMGAAGDAHRPFRVPHQPAEGDREAGGEGDDDGAVVVLVRGADLAPTAGQVANGRQTAPWRVVAVLVVGDVNRGVCVRVWQRPGWCAPGGREGDVAGSSSVRTSNHWASGLSSPAPSFQTFCRIRVRSPWSVRSSSCVSRGGGAVQSRCGRRQIGHDHKFAMHGLQNQCSCSVPPQPRSCPRRGLPSSSFTSMQTPHGFPGRGCGASPSGILRPKIANFLPKIVFF